MSAHIHYHLEMLPLTVFDIINAQILRLLSNMQCCQLIEGGEHCLLTHFVLFCADYNMFNQINSLLSKSSKL